MACCLVHTLSLMFYLLGIEMFPPFAVTAVAAKMVMCESTFLILRILKWNLSISRNKPCHC